MRLRPRFSLRPLFVLVTIVGLAGGWVAYQLNWIRQRHEIVAYYGAAVAPKTGYYFALDVVSYEMPGDYFPGQAAPWHLRIFGERGYKEIGLFKNIRDRDLERISYLFPEAKVIRTDEEP